MTDAEARGNWIAYRENVAAQAVAAKQSQHTIFGLLDRYRSLTSDERRVIDSVISEELASADEAQRFDAIALINEFRIKSAVPALRALADRP